VFRLDPAELHRGFPEAQHAVQHEPEYAPQHGAPRREDLAARLAAAEAENTALHAAAQMRDETISDLRHRLDQSDADWRLALDRLAAAQERIAALLTDQRQPARRSWWRWR
jgi:DNA repair exonuclease SbcCD ATPase subunit